MKMRLTSIILALCISALAFGQEGEAVSSSSGAGLVSKKGVNILPEAGEIALGVDASPFLLYAGNAITIGGTPDPAFNFANYFDGRTGIYVKYLLTANMAARAGIRADFSSSTDIEIVDQAPTAGTQIDVNNPLYVEDEITTVNNDVELALGIEMTRGSSRVQGKYGAELVIGSNKDEINYIYGNSITSEITTPGTHNDAAVYDDYRRLIKDYDDKGFYFGARAFIGVEFFIGPKISLGGEFGYAYLLTTGENQTMKFEYWDSDAQAVSTMYQESSNPGLQRYELGVDNLNGEINLFFYF